jgi:hypothetical protein
MFQREGWWRSEGFQVGLVLTAGLAAIAAPYLIVIASFSAL